MTYEQLPVLADAPGKKCSRGWALSECSLEVPAGRIEVVGDAPDGRGTHPSVSYLTQQKPLYPQFTVAETLKFGRNANPGGEQAYAEELVARATVPLTAGVGTLSGGQRTANIPCRVDGPAEAPAVRSASPTAAGGTHSHQDSRRSTALTPASAHWANVSSRSSKLGDHRADSAAPPPASPT